MKAKKEELWKISVWFQAKRGGRKKARERGKDKEREREREKEREKERAKERESFPQLDLATHIPKRS